MILGVDHLALSCGNLNRSCSMLEESGFIIQFREPSLLNHSAKTPFLKSRSELHGIAYARGASGPAIELTAHETPLSGSPGAYRSVWRCAPAGASTPTSNAVPQAAVDSGLVGSKAMAWPAAGIEVWLAQQDGPRCVSCVALGVPDMDASLAFWHEGFRARAISADDRHAHLQFVSPSPALQADLLLFHANDDLPDPRLDAPGHACLALISSAIAADGDAVMKAGGRRRSGVFDLTVAGRVLAVELIEGPNGELVELIQIRRT